MLYFARSFLSFHCFFSSPFFVFFSVSAADIRVVGLFAVSPRVNELSARMSVTRSNDSAQAGMRKNKDLLTGYIYLRVNHGLLSVIITVTREYLPPTYWIELIFLATAEDADLCAISCQLWTDCPDCLIVGLDRTSRRGKMVRLQT